jgi:hypothetical protein
MAGFHKTLAEMRAKKARTARHKNPLGDHGHAARPFITFPPATKIAELVFTRPSVALSSMSDAFGKTMAQVPAYQAIQGFLPPIAGQLPVTDSGLPAQFALVSLHSDGQFLSEWSVFRPLPGTIAATAWPDSRRKVVFSINTLSQHRIITRPARGRQSFSASANN